MTVPSFFYSVQSKVYFTVNYFTCKFYKKFRSKISYVSVPERSSVWHPSMSTEKKVEGRGVGLGEGITNTSFKKFSE